MAEGILDTEPRRAAPPKDISEALLAQFKKSDFWELVKESGGCWSWRAAVNNKGYGRFSFNGEVYGAHRVAFALGKDTALPGVVFVCHRCDNPGCVNPSHLFLGTNADNMADMKAKGRGRGPKGLENGRGKLSAEDIQAIRESTERQVDLCRKYGVSDGHISRILSGGRRANP
jgi:hypothetical protein